MLFNIIIILFQNDDILLKYFKEISENGDRNTKIIVNILINEFLSLVHKNSSNLEKM